MNANRRTALAKFAVVSLFSAPALLSQATTTKDVFNGVFGSASISYTQPDGCTNVSVQVTVSEQGTTSLNAPNAAPSARADIFIFNNCTGSAIFESGTTTEAIRFTAQAAGNGSKVPKSVAASGMVPMEVVFGPPGTPVTDTLNIDVTLNSVGPAIDTTSDSKQTNYLDTQGKSSVQVRIQTDSVSSDGSIASLNVSSANLGLLSPVTVPFASFSRLGTDKHRTVTLTH